MVVPVTTPRIKGLNVAKTAVWLPDGIWYDIYMGMRYEGGRLMDAYRGINSIPVFAKAGTILVCTDEISAKEAISNPKSLDIKVFPEDDGAFALYEDDNETCDYEKGRFVITNMNYSSSEDSFVIEPAAGDLSFIPDSRTYIVEFCSRTKEAASKVKVNIDGKDILAKISYDNNTEKLYVTVNAKTTSRICITISGNTAKKKNNIEKRCFDFLNQAEIDFGQKDAIYNKIITGKKRHILLSELKAMELDDDLYGAVAEIVTA